MNTKLKATLIVTTFSFLFLLSAFAILPTAAATGAPSVTASHLTPGAIIVNSKPTKEDCPDCWSGYGVASSTSGSVTGASATFTVPSIKCTSAETLSAFGAVLDGSSASDFSYAIVEAICDGGSLYLYAVWYNAADGSSGAASWTPNVGDSVTTSLSEASGTITFTITDATQSQTLTGTGSDTGMSLTAGTCFTDMAAGYGQVNFGTISFTDCTATVNGHTGGVGSFGKSVTVLEWITFNSADSKALNKVGKLMSKEDFTVTFKKAGP
jgi:Peptidase A4 family